MLTQYWFDFPNFELNYGRLESDGHSIFSILFEDGVIVITEGDDESDYYFRQTVVLHGPSPR